MIRLTVQTALVCLIALSVAGCAVELPLSSFTGSRLAPPDATLKSDATAQRRPAPTPSATR